MACRVRCTKAECFQNICGIECRLLDEEILDHECPFYKTDAQVIQERKDSILNLRLKGRKDLIEYYEMYRGIRNY